MYTSLRKHMQTSDRFFKETLVETNQTTHAFSETRVQTKKNNHAMYTLNFSSEMSVSVRDHLIIAVTAGMFFS